MLLHNFKKIPDLILIINVVNNTQKEFTVHYKSVKEFLDSCE